MLLYYLNCFMLKIDFVWSNNNCVLNIDPSKCHYPIQNSLCGSFVFIVWKLKNKIERHLIKDNERAASVSFVQIITLLNTSPKSCPTRGWSGETVCSDLEMILKIFDKLPIAGLFFYIFVFSIQLTVNVQYKFMLMTGL